VNSMPVEIRKKAQPNIAVCLAAFNGMRWLPEQLDSILNQTDVSVTVFVSVDHSTDGTEGWINDRSAEDERIVILPHGASFGGAARNFFRLLREVDFDGFDYVSLADQDDIWFEGKLKQAHDLLALTGADAYSSNVMALWPSGKTSLIVKSQHQRAWDFLFEAAGPGCTYVMKVALVQTIQIRLRQCWAEVQEVGLHDWFLYAFARANRYQWVIDEQANMYYRQHDDNQVGVNTGWQAFNHRMHKILSGWALSQAALISGVVGLGGDPFVVRCLHSGRLGFLRLAIHAMQCRRRARDRVIFVFSCLAVCVVGSSVR